MVMEAVNSGLDYIALWQELYNDPLHLGYSGYLANGDDQAPANLLNNIGSGPLYTVYRNDIASKEVVNAIQPADFQNMAVIQALKLQILFQGAPTDATLSGVRSNFVNVFSGASGTISALAALSTRQGSRAEVLFGDGISITAGEIVQALHVSGQSG